MLTAKEDAAGLLRDKLDEQEIKEKQQLAKLQELLTGLTDQVFHTGPDAIKPSGADPGIGSR